jgi:3-oxoacyl-[acyl-carrier-protein] synthase II
MISGGTEAAVHRVGVGAFNAMRALSKDEDPSSASRPFNDDVNGFVMGEGAGILIFETLEHALGRGAHIYAEVIGYGETSDAYHDTQPSGEGAKRAMRLALEEAGIRPGQIDYINAHGTSTPAGDIKELEAIEEVLGEDAPKVAISSTKSMTAHLLGAAGGVEGVICVKALEEGIIPPTINLRTSIKEALNLVPNVAQVRPIDIAMSNSFGFGGINSVLIFRRYHANS